MAFCILNGIIFLLAAVWQFYRAETTINPSRLGHEAYLVTSGIYRITRDPMYVGMAWIVLAGAFASAAISSFIILPAFIIAITKLQIMPEERVLSARFGETFIAYTCVTARWL